MTLRCGVSVDDTGIRHQPPKVGREIGSFGGMVMLRALAGFSIDGGHNKNEDGMNGLVGKGTKCAAVAVVAVIGLAGPASAGANCDTYAKLTLQQVKQNETKNCGFKGARWSNKATDHRNWCRSEGPAKWRAELQLREKMLQGCKG